MEYERWLGECLKPSFLYQYVLIQFFGESNRCLLVKSYDIGHEMTWYSGLYIFSYFVTFAAFLCSTGTPLEPFTIMVHKFWDSDCISCDWNREIVECLSIKFYDFWSSTVRFKSLAMWSCFPLKVNKSVWMK